MNEAALSTMDPARLQALWTRVREEFLQRQEQEMLYDLYAVTVFWNGEVELLYRACESDLGLQVRLTREGNAGDGVPFLLENKEEQEEDPEAIPVPSLPEVLRFYRRQGTETQYGWCWLDRDHQALVEYTGTVGAVGQRRYIPWNGTPEQGRSLLEQAGTRLRERGYRPWAPQEEIWLVVQIPIPKVEFCGDMLFDVKGLQQQVEQLLAQSLDQLGLGYLDNQEFGPSSDISDAYVLNFYCVAVDRDRGTQGVCSALKELANAPQFKVAAMSPEEEDYALAYSSDGNRTFCL